MYIGIQYMPYMDPMGMLIPIVLQSTSSNHMGLEMWVWTPPCFGGPFDADTYIGYEWKTKATKSKFQRIYSKESKRLRDHTKYTKIYSEVP